MLSEQSAPIIRDTLPVIGAAIEDIAETFYARLFRDRPELLRDLFNRGNQASGEQRKALAGSIVAFAGMLLRAPDSRPDAMLGRIAHKHASLGITPDQYKLVHEHLFAAIGDVLGEAVTEDIVTAWDEVYWLMANALIAIESRLYREVGTPDGDVQRPMEIVDRRQETPDVVSLVLSPVDGESAACRPGQYVSVQVELPDGARQIRQYSLSCAPERTRWRITVKRVHGDTTPDGEVSACLHAARVGDVLMVSAPFGDLVPPLDGDRPLVLVSAGIGVTPMIAILDHLVLTGANRAVTVVHADRSPSHHAHREEQRCLVDAIPGAMLHLWYEDLDGSETGTAGRVDLDSVAIPEGAVILLCGPLPFMRGVRDGLLGRGVPARDVHYEVFGPDLWAVGE